jgi:ferritin-like metal-binding protein YciE
MSMDTPRDLFEHELLDAYDAEHRLLEALPTMAKEVADDKLKSGFERHLQQTREHIQRIEEACKVLGIKAEREACPGMAGLLKEHDTFLKEKPSPEVLTLFLLGAAQKVEHYEMVSYRGLINMAKQMGEKDVVTLLQQNLKDEEAMAAELEKLEKTREKELIGAAR